MSVGRAFATARQDTLLVDHQPGAHTQSQMLSPRPVSHYREHERDPESRAGSSRSHSGSPVSAYASCGGEREAASCGIRASQSRPGVSLDRHKHHREWIGEPECAQAPTDAALYQLYLHARAVRKSSSSRTLPHQHSQSHARSATAVTGGGTGSRGSSVNVEDLLDVDGDGDVEKEDALLDDEGEGEGEGAMDIDEEIARTRRKRVLVFALLAHEVAELESAQDHAAELSGPERAAIPRHAHPRH
ncbi:hypothetical protein DFH11DRAFT_1701808 [Phellopilus nigrolimitatus]|nr:hypothetical protein DFH11DRAFT_1701808 [Phellopilus nigrolimitatus]